MEESIEEEGLQHLQHIEQELSEIKERTPGSWRSFINGIWQGAGAVLGSIAAVILLGWILSIFGLLPGFATIAHYIQNAFAQLHNR